MWPQVTGLRALLKGSLLSAGAAGGYPLLQAVPRTKWPRMTEPWVLSVRSPMTACAYMKSSCQQHVSRRKKYPLYPPAATRSEAAQCQRCWPRFWRIRASRAAERVDGVEVLMEVGLGAFGRDAVTAGVGLVAAVGLALGLSAGGAT